LNQAFISFSDIRNLSSQHGWRTSTPACAQATGYLLSINLTERPDCPGQSP
jgi:hypothetical protein